MSDVTPAHKNAAPSSQVGSSLEISSGAFVVNSSGEMLDHELLQPQEIIHREILDRTHSETTIDLQRVRNESIHILFQDFGLPFRAITLSPRYKNPWAQEDDEPLYLPQSYEGEPLDHISVRLPSPYGGYTNIFQWSGGKIQDSEWKLVPEGNFGVAHEGESADSRNGFVDNEEYIWLLDGAVDADFDYGGRYAMIVNGYLEGDTLRLESLNDTVVEVLYTKTISLEDHVSESETERTEFDVNAVIHGLEVTLARNKGLLRDSRAENQRLHYELRQARQNQPASSQAETTAGTKSEDDPFGYCSLLGFDSKHLLAMEPSQATELVKGLRKTYARLFHPDGNTEVGPTAMRDINAASDKLLERLATGYWGRN